jgi:transketolase
MALAAKQALKSHRIFVLLSDGDCNEGSTWEAIMFAAQHGFDNLTAIVDYNRVQALGESESVISMEPFVRKIEDFGWGVREIDGHDIEEIITTLNEVPFAPSKPSFIIARTVKCRGISSLENTVKSHYQCISDDELETVYKELGVNYEKCL